jgi:hypothetical protein
MLDLFAWVGEFSSGLVSDTEFRLEKHLPGFLDHPDEVNRKLERLFLSCGRGSALGRTARSRGQVEAARYPILVVPNPRPARVEGVVARAGGVRAEGVSGGALRRRFAGRRGPEVRRLVTSSRPADVREARY